MKVHKGINTGTIKTITKRDQNETKKKNNLTSVVGSQRI
jgi:hypothetical protein